MLEHVSDRSCTLGADPVAIKAVQWVVEQMGHIYYTDEACYISIYIYHNDMAAMARFRENQKKHM